MNKTIVEIFEGIPDYRKGNAIKHKLSDILTIGLLSVICNVDAISEMKLFTETHELLLREFLELPYGIPSEDTFERVFTKLNPQTLQTQFQTYMKDIKELIQENASLLLSSSVGIPRGLFFPLLFGIYILRTGFGKSYISFQNKSTPKGCYLLNLLGLQKCGIS